MPGKHRNIVVMGTAEGGLQALDNVISGLPTDCPASIFIVQHMAPQETGAALLQKLGQYKSFHCKLARNLETFKGGRIYIAPPDNHLLVKENKVLVTKGARENRFRPGVDPLFRSAAVAYGPQVIGVILTGMLDDGAVGLQAVDKCGGVTVVQDPKEAPYPQMPQNAVDSLKVDYCVPSTEMGSLLGKLVKERPGKSTPISPDLRTEAIIAEQVLSDIGKVSALGHQVPYNCPNCAGPLWEMDRSKIKRYRCHTGHSFTASALLESQSEKIEETLWTSLRMFEERKNLLNNVAQSVSSAQEKNNHRRRATEAQVHIQRIRAILTAPDTSGRWFRK